MFNKIIGIIHGTPVWVWFLFGYLIYRGIKGLKSRIMPLSNVFIMPGIFLALSLQNIVSRMCACFDTTIFLTYLLFLLFGIVIGWMIVLRMKVVVDKKRHLIAMPGSVFVLIFTLLIFGVKYFFGYMKAVNPEAISFFAIVSFVGISGVIAGITIGRMLHYLYLYKKASHTDLL